MFCLLGPVWRTLRVLDLSFVQGFSSGPRWFVPRVYHICSICLYVFNSNTRFWPSPYKNNEEKSLKPVVLILKAIIQCSWFFIINYTLYLNAYLILYKLRFVTLLDVVLFFFFSISLIRKPKREQVPWRTYWRPCISVLVFKPTNVNFGKYFNFSTTKFSELLNVILYALKEKVLRQDENQEN